MADQTAQPIWVGKLKAWIYFGCRHTLRTNYRFSLYHSDQFLTPGADFSSFVAPFYREKNLTRSALFHWILTWSAKLVWILRNIAQFFPPITAVHRVPLDDFPHLCNPVEQSLKGHLEYTSTVSAPPPPRNRARKLDNCSSSWKECGDRKCRNRLPNINITAELFGSPA